MKQKFYVTNAIPYVNDKPHVGHALEFTQSDTITRYHKYILKQDTNLLCGGDENAIKNVQAAEKAGQPVQEFIDKNTQTFKELAEKLNVHFDVFQKGSNQETHFPSCQKLWELCEKSGDIYKKPYEGLYCVGCETFYNADELNENGECFEHPGRKLVLVSEENYYFRLSKYQEQLIELISTDKLKIIPEIRKNEVLSFLKQPLQDISISRTNERAKNWGVPVPGDDSQRMYVWFDALNVYQSGIGFGWNDEEYKKWWPADVQVIGKGIIRFHAVYWPAFLMSAGLELPKNLFVHGYFTVDGQKMSKTLGNVIDPVMLIEKYGADPLRYYFLREIPAYSDGDFSERRFIELYNADLANNLGNLISRVEKLLQQNNLSPKKTSTTPNRVIEKMKPFLDLYQFDKALEYIWTRIDALNKYINDTKPWENKYQAPTILQKIVDGDSTADLDSIYDIGESLQPFMPDIANDIMKRFTQDTVTLADPLFPRIK